MNVSCPQCSTVYRVDPAKVPEGGVRARCSTCSGVIPVGITTAPAPRRATPVDALGAAFGARPAAPGPYAPGRQALQAQAPAPATPARPAPVRQTPVASPSVQATPPSAQPPISAPPVQAPPLGASLPGMRQTPRTSLPAAAQAPAAPAPGKAAGGGAEQPGSATRRPINPFLARDPSLRAKRLARALVSDMVAYYPAKHSEGLEKGTLKELFRDEIKKSYDEYVGQVGADFARTTTHFQESLNEVLGAGKKIF